MTNSRKKRSTKKNTEIHQLRTENAALKRELASLKPIVVEETPKNPNLTPKTL
jgi:hypothetical protein